MSLPALFVLIIVSGVISQEFSVAPTALPPVKFARPDAATGLLGRCFPRCRIGSTCQKQVIYCITAPCPQPNPPRYICIPNLRPGPIPCASILCPSGTYCSSTGSTARCVQEGGCVNTCPPGRVCPAICITAAPALQ